MKKVLGAFGMRKKPTKEKSANEKSGDEKSKDERHGRKKKKDKDDQTMMTEGLEEEKPAKKDRAKKKKKDPEVSVMQPENASQQQNPQQQQPQGGSEQVVKWVNRALDMGVVKLREEYRELAQYTSPEMTTTAFKANHEAGKNRYQDVPCQDQNRVTLNFPGSIDYIHANYVSTPQGGKRFICTQGPLDCTINEFWAMIVQEEASIIVMLCNVIEMGKLKCAQYWRGRGEVVKCEALGIEVQNKGFGHLDKEPSVKKTILKVKWKNGEREVCHFQWLDWPDRGVPPCRLTAMELLSCVRGSKMPIVVHCSAGIGRTGTIVAIEYILERLCAKEECAAMNELLKMLRNQRAFSIQNDLQYLYIHRVMLCYFLDKHTDKYGFILKEADYQAKYNQFLTDYSAATGTQ